MTKNIFLLLFAFLFQLSLVAQEDPPADEISDSYSESDLAKEKLYMEFTTYFMEAQREKAIENYVKVQDLLSKCENIYPDNFAMLFEKAKNHFQLQQYTESHWYCDKALAQKPDFFWVKVLKKDIYLKENNFPEALELQKQLYASDRNQAENLLALYMQLKDYESGKKLLNEVNSKIIFVENKAKYQLFFNSSSNQNTTLGDEKNEVTPPIDPQPVKNIEVLNDELLRLANIKQWNVLAEKSMQAIGKFPTDPLGYYYSGLADNNLKKYNQAVQFLENGLDFIFDNNTLIIKFYNELIAAYKALNNTAKSNYYQQLVQKLQK